MDTSQILAALESDPVTRKKFCGVFSSDHLPKVVDRFPCGFIANTGPADKPGLHWVCFYFQSKLKGEFFDSYGRPPDYYQEIFKEYLINHGDNWTFNSKQLQSVSSDVCGQYCVFYLSHRARGHSMNTIVNMLDSNRNVNDKKVFRFVRRHFYMSPKTYGTAEQISRKRI